MKHTSQQTQLYFIHNFNVLIRNSYVKSYVNLWRMFSNLLSHFTYSTYITVIWFKYDTATWLIHNNYVLRWNAYVTFLQCKICHCHIMNGWNCYLFLTYWHWLSFFDLKKFFGYFLLLELKKIVYIVLQLFLNEKIYFYVTKNFFK